MHSKGNHNENEKDSQLTGREYLQWYIWYTLPKYIKNSYNSKSKLSNFI